MYKVIVSDLDGTLLTPEHIISDYTQETIHQLIGSGYKFIIATGRHRDDIKVIRESIKEDIYLITSNGARVYDKQDKLVYSQNIIPEIAQIISELPAPDCITLNVYRDEEWFINKENEILRNFSQGSAFTYQVANLKALNKENIAKMFFWGPHEELTKLAATISAQAYSDRLNLSFSLPTCLEIMDIKVNKAQALTEVLKLKGYTLDDTIAFGDGMNDYEMLKAAKKGVLMGNRSNMLSEVLPGYEQTATSREDGVARYIRENIL